MEFYVDGTGQGTNGGGAFSQWLDVRNFVSGTHRVSLVARDNSGNFSTRDLNVFITTTPPPAPQVVTPAADIVVNTNTVLIAGWQAPNTLGRRLVEHEPVVKIFGEEYQVKAQVEVINGFSGHADRTELIEWAKAIAPSLG